MEVEGESLGEVRCKLPRPTMPEGRVISSLTQQLAMQRDVRSCFGRTLPCLVGRVLCTASTWVTAHSCRFCAVYRCNSARHSSEIYI